VLRGDGDSVGSVLFPRRSLIEAVEPRKVEGSSLLLRCTIVWGNARWTRYKKSPGGTTALAFFIRNDITAFVSRKCPAHIN
jgi:hypothetical protein